MEKRIAFFGPLSPIDSGISDYDEELLPLLRNEYQIDVFTGSDTRHASAFHHSEFYFKQRRRPYDLIIYQMGNSLFHEYMYGYLFHFPGVIIFHDYCLHQSRATMLLSKGLIQEYIEEAKLDHPMGVEIGQAVASGIFSELFFYYFPFVRMLLKSALAAAAHTEIVAEKLRVTGTPVIHIPMAVLCEPCRLSQDPYPGKLVLASFGLATRAKRILQILPAIARLARTRDNLLYLIVGSVGHHLHLEEEIQQRGMEDLVKVTGRVGRKEFLELMNRADIILNLRYPSAGEMSATLLRAMACGKPVLISRIQFLREIPRDVALRVRPDHEIEDIYTNLEELINDPDLRTRLGTAAKNHIETHHKAEQMVEGYRRLIELGFQRKARFHPPGLPMHLRNGREIVRDYLKRTSFPRMDSDLLEWIL